MKKWFKTFIVQIQYILAASLKYFNNSAYTSPSNFLAFEPSSLNSGLNNLVNLLRVNVL